jgi:hypothetical protein
MLSYFSDKFYKRFIMDDFNTNLHRVGGTILVNTMAENAAYEDISTGYPVITFYTHVMKLLWGFSHEKN